MCVIHNSFRNGQFRQLGGKMKKEDLKTGMLVETRNGEKYIVLENVYGLQLLATGKGYMELDTHNEDLTYDEPDLDIVKVYALPRDKTCILKISTLS